VSGASKSTAIWTRPFQVSTLSRFAPEMRLHAERARRVLGGSEPRPSLGASGLGATLTFDGSESGVSAPPTVTAWGGHPGRERSPVVRRAGIASALLLALGALGFGFHYFSSKPELPGVASASSSLPLPLPPEPVRPVEQPSPQVTASAPSASAPEALPSARAVSVANKVRAVQKAVRPSAVSSAVSKPPSSGVPDFGGRR